MAKDFHNEPFDNETILKLQIFRGYTRQWLPVFLSKKSFDSVNIFDFFAGPGKDLSGKEGSPLIIIEEIKNYLANPALPLANEVSIRLFFNDIDKDKISTLQKEVAQKETKPINIEFTNLGFSEAFVSKIPLLKSSDAAKLIILDQHGIKQITHDVFKQLIGFPATDFMFFISSSTLKRFIEVEEIRKYFPEMSPEDIGNIPAADIHRFVCSYYKKLIPSEQEFYLVPFSIKKGANIYGIIFGSRSLLGLEKFLKVCWHKDRISGEANYDIDDDMIRKGETLFKEFNVSQKNDLFRKNLIDFLHVFRDNNILYKFTLENGCLPSHARDFLRALQKDGRLETDPVDTREGSFYLSWKYFKNNEIKAKFRVIK